MIARPVSLPPAWTIRRAECPPSSPSASSPSGLGVEAHPARSQLLDGRRRLAGQHLDRARPAQAAPGGERVGGVALGRVVGGERRREPALRPEARALGERLARDEHRRGARRGGLERDVQPGGAAADHDHVALAARGRRSTRRGTVLGTRWRSTLASVLASPRHRRPSRERRAPGRDRGGARARRAGPGSSASRRRRRPASSSTASTTPRTSTRSRRFCARGRRDDRPRHDRLRRTPSRPRCTRPAAPRARPSGCSPARRDGGVLRPAPARPPRRARPGDGLLPVQQRRRRRPRTRSTPAAPSGC